MNSESPTRNCSTDSGRWAHRFFACIIEDFLSARFGEGGEENVVDAYLARRGWLEKGQARNYLLALRDSTPSVYEVVGFKRGREVTVRDLIRESEPVRVDEQAGSETLGLWDCVFARVVRVGRTTCFTGAVLHFPRELAQRCLERLGGIARDLRKEIRKAAKKLGEDQEASEAEARDFLLQSPKPAFSSRIPSRSGPWSGWRPRFPR